MSTRPGKVMALDIGMVRIGVAVSDPDRILATPLTTITRDGDNDWKNHVVSLLQEEAATMLLIGLPIDLRGNSGIAAEKMKELTKDLSHTITQEYPIEVQLVDERMTTVIAAQQLRERGKNSRDSRQIIDRVAAVILLQNWLDSQRKLFIHNNF